MRKEMTNLSDDLRMLGLDGAVSKLTEDVTKTVPDYIKSWQEAGYKIALVETKGGTIVESAFVLGKYPQLLQERVAAGGGIIGTPYSFKLHNGKLGGKQLTEEKKISGVLLSCLVCGAKTKAVNESVVVPCSQCHQPINGQLAENVEYLEEGKELKPGSTDDIERLLKSLVGFDVEVYNGKDKALGELRDNSGESGYNHSDYEVAGNRPVRFNVDDVMKINGSDIQVARSVNFLDEAAAPTAKKKSFRIQDDIGKAKYTVSFHDGVKTHKDGSPFYDIEIFRNKEKRDQFVNKLKTGGYLEESKSSLDELNSQGEPVHEKKEPKAGFDAYHDLVNRAIEQAGQDSILSQDEFETVVTAHEKGFSAKECAKEIINGRSGKTEARKVANYPWKGGEQLWTAVRGKVESVMVMSPTPQHMDGFMVSFEDGGSKIVYGPDLFKTQEEAEEDLKYHSQAPAKKGELSEDYEFSVVALRVPQEDKHFKEWEKEMAAFDRQRKAGKKYVHHKASDLSDDLFYLLKQEVENEHLGDADIIIEYKNGSDKSAIDVRMSPEQLSGLVDIRHKEENEQKRRRALELSEGQQQGGRATVITEGDNGTVAQRAVNTLQAEYKKGGDPIRAQMRVQARYGIADDMMKKVVNLAAEKNEAEEKQPKVDKLLLEKKRRQELVRRRWMEGCSEAERSDRDYAFKPGMRKPEAPAKPQDKLQGKDEQPPVDDKNKQAFLEARRGKLAEGKQKDGKFGVFVYKKGDDAAKDDEFMEGQSSYWDNKERAIQVGKQIAASLPAKTHYVEVWEKDAEGLWGNTGKPLWKSDLIKEKIETTPEYWDCECDKDYIHSKNQKKCDKCGAVSSDQPDSRASEVRALGLPVTQVESWESWRMPSQKKVREFIQKEFETHSGELNKNEARKIFYKQFDQVLAQEVLRKLRGEGRIVSKGDNWLWKSDAVAEAKDGIERIGVGYKSTVSAGEYEGKTGTVIKLIGEKPNFPGELLLVKFSDGTVGQVPSHSFVGKKKGMAEANKGYIDKWNQAFKEITGGTEDEYIAKHHVIPDNIDRKVAARAKELMGESNNRMAEADGYMCPECGKRDMEYDPDTKNYVCTHCGLGWPKEKLAKTKIKKINEADSSEHISGKYHELEYNGGDYKYSLGNLSDAGWFWDGTKGDNMMLLFLYRLVHSKVWTPELKKQLVDFKGLADFYKKARTNNSELSELAYSVAGDNVTFGFGNGYWDMFDDEIDYEKNVPTKKIETTVQDETKAWLKKDLPSDLGGFLDWANKKDDITEKVVEIWNDTVYSMAPMKSEKRDESVKITGHLMTEESFRNRRSKRKMKTVRMVSGAKRIGECLELDEASREKELDAARDILDSVYNDFNLDDAPNGLAEEVKKQCEALKQNKELLKAIADEVGFAWADSPSAEGLQVVFLADPEGNVQYEYFGHADYWGGASWETFPYRSHVMVPSAVEEDGSGIRAEIKKIGEAIGIISGANKSDKVTKNMVEDINNILAVMAKRVKSLAEADEMGDEEAENELADMETLKSQVGEISDKLDGGTEVTVQDILPVISALIGVLENYIEVAQKILDAIGGEDALAPKEEPPQEEPGQSPETNTPETPSDLSQAVPPPGQESKAGRDNLVEADYPKQVVAKFHELETEMDKIYDRLYFSQESKEKYAKLLGGDAYAMTVMGDAGRELRKIHPEVTEQIAYVINMSLGFGMMPREEKQDAMNDIKKIYFPDLEESHLMEGANTKTITDKKGNEILVSYQTPVAAKIDGKYYRTDKNWSATTAKHIGQYLPGQGPLAKRKAEVKPQEWFDQLLKIGGVTEAKQQTNAEVLKRVKKMFAADFEFVWKKAMKVYTPVDDKSAAALKKAGFGDSFTAGQEDAVQSKISKLYPGVFISTVGGPEEYDEAKMTYEAWVKKLDKAGESVPLTKFEFESWMKVKGKVPTVKEALTWKGYVGRGGKMIPTSDPQGPDDISHLKHLPEIPLDEAKETSADKLAKKIKTEDTLELMDILEDGENTDSAMNEMIADNVKYVIERELGEKVLKTVIVDIEDKNLAGDNPNIFTDIYFAIFTASFKDGSTYSGRVFADGIVNGDRFDLHSITVGSDELRYFGP